ncbi:cysteine desulfurase [Periweissella cryptocerci]|uniref:Cysteine desulfurase n=1 Tax=Periweissella cryptocerci TaxID=2506420 RepID=A0A4P6YRR9_9LACO|nr:DUF1831 domain-containing protein [Periweissella cryptocerci]QBO35344.1 cysteine desulfurase [Periweissella cryptocerci]
MAFDKQVQLLGDTDTYSVHPSIKKYSLMDTGFIQQNSGAYQLMRQLEPNKAFNASFKLKIVFAQDLSGFKMKTVNALGNTVINIFTHKNSEVLTQQFHFYIQELVDREILVKD